jgi:hypothetical protein
MKWKVLTSMIIGWQREEHAEPFGLILERARKFGLDFLEVFLSDARHE